MTVRIGDHDVPDGVIILPVLILLFGSILGVSAYFQDIHMHVNDISEGIVISKDVYGGGGMGGTTRTICLVETINERIAVRTGCTLLAVGDQVKLTIHDDKKSRFNMKIELIK